MPLVSHWAFYKALCPSDKTDNFRNIDARHTSKALMPCVTLGHTRACEASRSGVLVANARGYIGGSVDQIIISTGFGSIQYIHSILSVCDHDL